MQIRQKLSFQFLGIVTVILLLSSLSIYFFSASYRQDDFYNRLKNKASITARLLIEVDEVDADLLQKIETNNPVTLPKERILIYDGNNEIVFSTDNEHSLKIDTGLLEEIRSESEISFNQEMFEALGFVFGDSQDEFLVIIGASDIHGRKKLVNLRTILIIVFGISMLIAYALGWIYAGRALKPISSVIDQVDNISISSMDLRVNGGEGNDEISKLAATFNHMLDRLEKAFRMQKDFITNASHELRTPLTAISGQLEVLLMQERTSEEYTESIASVMEDMRSLNGTANRLLLLAQASTESPSKHFERIRVDEVLWQVRSELLKLNPEYSIQIELDTSLDEEYKLSTNGNLLLMKAAISNLAENACKYSENKTVRINMVFEAELVTISFEDRGIGIHSDDLEIIFEPFHRGRNAGTFKGHGIGLSLVRRIVEMHNGHLLVRSSLSEGSVFILELPALHN